MTAAELRALAGNLGDLSRGLERGDKDAVLVAANILGLLAWAEENKVEAVRRRNGYSVHVGLAVYADRTLIDTLRRAREAAR